MLFDAQDMPIFQEHGIWTLVLRMAHLSSHILMGPKQHVDPLLSLSG